MASPSSRACLSVGDYIVMAAMLVISLVIGFYFACTGGRQRSQREYLLAEGKMSFWPVCLSLFASFQSAISLLGNPADAMITHFGVIVGLASIATVFVIVPPSFIPLFHLLRLVNVYQYLELRYSSTVERRLGAGFGVFTMVTYMGFALLSPAVAIEAVTGIPIWMSLVVVAAMGTVYSAIASALPYRPQYSFPTFPVHRL